MRHVTPFTVVVTFWNVVLTAVAVYSVRGYLVEPIKTVKAEVLSAQTDHIIYRTTWWRMRDCRTVINRFVLDKEYYDRAVGTGADPSAVVPKDDRTYHRSMVPGWSRLGLPVPQLRTSTVYVGGLRLPEGRDLLLTVVTDSFCPTRNRQNPYDPVPFTVPSGSDEGIVINRYDYGP